MFEKSMEAVGKHMRHIRPAPLKLMCRRFEHFIGLGVMTVYEKLHSRLLGCLQKYSEKWKRGMCIRVVHTSHVSYRRTALTVGEVIGVSTFYVRPHNLGRALADTAAAHAPYPESTNDLLHVLFFYLMRSGDRVDIDTMHVPDSPVERCFDNPDYVYPDHMQMCKISNRYNMATNIRVYRLLVLSAFEESASADDAIAQCVQLRAWDMRERLASFMRRRNEDDRRIQQQRANIYAVQCDQALDEVNGVRYAFNVAVASVNASSSPEVEWAVRRAAEKWQCPRDGLRFCVVDHWTAGQMAVGHQFVVGDAVLRCAHADVHIVGARSAFFRPPGLRDRAIVVYENNAMRLVWLSWMFRMHYEARHMVHMRKSGLSCGWWAPFLADVAKHQIDNTILTTSMLSKVLCMMTGCLPTNTLLDVPSIMQTHGEHVAAMLRLWQAETRIWHLHERLWDGDLSVRQMASLVTPFCEGGIRKQEQEMMSSNEGSNTVVPSTAFPLATITQLFVPPLYINITIRAIEAVTAMLIEKPDIVSRHRVYEGLEAYLSSDELLHKISRARDNQEFSVCIYDPRSTSEPNSAPTDNVTEYAFEGNFSLDFWYPSVVAALLRLCTEKDTPPWLVVWIVTGITYGSREGMRMRKVSQPGTPSDEMLRHASLDLSTSVKPHKKMDAMERLCNIVQKVSFLPRKTVADDFIRGRPVDGCRLLPVATVFSKSPLTAYEDDGTEAWQTFGKDEDPAEVCDARQHRRIEPADARARKAWNEFLTCHPRNLPARLSKSGCFPAFYSDGGRAIMSNTVYPVWTTGVMSSLAQNLSLGGASYDAFAAVWLRAENMQVDFEVIPPNFQLNQ